jgi:hypothetical protein
VDKERLEEKLNVDNCSWLIQSSSIDYTRTINLTILGEISAGQREDIIDARDLGENIEILRTLAPGNDSQYWLSGLTAIAWSPIFCTRTS